ncbi:MAG: hypothetical protein IPJ19_15120 [Planctomycetes bacterium]|nr:hypothetical protein [Planctomycetota bacterium]
MLARLACLLSLLWFVCLCAGDPAEDWKTLRDSKDLAARIEAAKSLVAGAQQRGECGKLAGDLADLGTKFTTPPQLREAIAGALAGCQDALTAKELARRIGPGQEHEKLFLLHASRGCVDELLDRAVRERLLPDRSASVRAAALELLVKHASRASLPALEGILREGRDAEMLAPVVRGISELRRGTPEWGAWDTRLVELTSHKASAVRNAALAELARDADGSREELFLAALSSPDWSARAIALDWMASHFTKRGLGALIAQLAHEPDGSRLRADLASVLQHLTAMPLGDDPQRWAEWWKNSASSFEFPASAGGARSSERKRDARAGSTYIAAKFYGVEIESQRVIFVIDISGSMQQPLVDVPKDMPAAGTGEKPARIEAAKFELAKIVQDLAPGSIFNIISFNDGVDAWLEHLVDFGGAAKSGAGGVAGPRSGPERAPPREEKAAARERERDAKAEAEMRAQAKTYIERLGAKGGTNLYDALETAFEDPLVDTIVVLSDGQPSAGKETDPAIIRADVQRWNQVRRIRIHTVSVGTDFEILRWLAKDSGGDHRWVR